MASHRTGHTARLLAVTASTIAMVTGSALIWTPAQAQAQARVTDMTCVYIDHATVTPPDSGAARPEKITVTGSGLCDVLSLANGLKIGLYTATRTATATYSALKCTSSKEPSGTGTATEAIGTLGLAKIAYSRGASSATGGDGMLTLAGTVSRDSAVLPGDSVSTTGDFLGLGCGTTAGESSETSVMTTTYSH